MRWRNESILSGVFKKMSKEVSFAQLGSFGRLGNQMFQYAALVGISERVGHRVVVSRKKLVGSEHHGQKCLLSNFALTSASDADPSGSAVCWNEQSAGVFYDESLFETAARESFLTIRNSHLENPRYFAHARDRLLADFALPPEIETAGRAAVAAVKTTKRKVCLHLRLGDNLVQPFFFTASAAFLRQVLTKEMREKSHFLIFAGGTRAVDQSDDVARARVLLLEAGLDESEFSLMSGNDVLLDLATMKNCDDFVLSGGTFGFWAAYLGRTRDDQTVHYPVPWYNVPEEWFDVPDEHWHKISIKEFYC
jgi:hypothetical protein